jgi:hypothetical protein
MSNLAGMIIALYFGLLHWQEPEVVYSSEALAAISLSRVISRDSILDDQGERFGLDRMQDEEGLIYWRRQLYTPVCQTGECKAIDVGIYWDARGRFFGLEVYGEHLTRTDHSVFSAEDYQRLVKVLADDWSILREYAYEDLMNKPAEGVDGLTGATRKEISEETVSGAVYTTYTLWHLVNQGEQAQIRKRTAKVLNEEPATLKLLAAQPDPACKTFLLELLREGILEHSASVTRLLMEALTGQDNAVLRELAYRTLDKIELQRPEIQEALAEIYPELSARDKTRLLNALDGDLPLQQPLYQALTRELSPGNEWFAARVLKVINHYGRSDPRMKAIAEKLAQSDNSFVKRQALDYLENN